MPIAEWENVDDLITPQGDLPLNTEQAAGLFIVSKDGAESGTDVRATGDPVPQAFGTIWHRGFSDGYVLKLPFQYWVDERTTATKLTTPTSQEMDDLLMRHLRSLMDGGGRILYTPEGQNRRLADSLHLIAKPIVTEGDGVTGCVVTLGSELPYLIDFNQTLTTLTSGAPTATLTNSGSSPYWPVFQVFGAFDDFILANTTTGEQIAYDNSLPGAVAVGGGDYIEIDTFRNTVYLNGSGANRKAGIFIPTSDFFPLEVGDNELTITSSGTAPNVDILWAPAWF